MTTLAVCRTCLARNTRMHVIANTQLQSIYEILSGTTLNTEDGKPNSLCYICFSQLRKCWKFKEMSRRTEELLTGIIHNGIRFTQENISLLNGETLSMSTTKFVSMPEYIKNENPEVYIKVEEVNRLGETISVEVQTEGSPVSEIPIDYDVRIEKLFKQEMNPTEYDGDLLDISSLSAVNQISNSLKSSKEHSKKLIAKAKRKGISKKSLNLPSSNTKENTYSSDLGSKLNNQKFNPKKHMITSTDAKLFPCIKCIETFSNKCDLQKHILAHTGEKLHICDVCSKVFCSKYSLKIHITQKHLAAKKMHNCDRCNKSFNHRGTLRLHMRIHTGDKPYACDKCSKTFSQKGTLQRHIRMHTGEKPYACDKCTKTFNQESSLKRHIKMHTGEKPYTCTRCGKAYYESSHLTRHIRTHTGEKPYACDRCFQTFSQSSNLQSHMKKHTGEKASNYVCYECNKTFDHKSIFKRHLLKHTREKPYPCDKCDKKYADKRTLQRHILTHNQSD